MIEIAALPFADIFCAVPEKSRVQVHIHVTVQSAHGNNFHGEK